MQPKIGVVIVSFNASLAVRATLASLRQAKNNVSYKVLLIDNASTPSEREAISIAFKKHTSEGVNNWEYIQLKKNHGFAGGNNYGIKRFLNDKEITHFCLLNSDVIVTDHWLDRLIEKECDIVSSVTNKADCEQCVPVDYELDLIKCIDTENEKVPVDAFETINNFAQRWSKAWNNNLVETEITFFCVLLSKRLVKEVGLLDQKFFPGGYEDDDYCERVKNKGFKIYLARDIFIHHFGSASFGQLQQNYFTEKASKNKAYFERKHKIKLKRRYERPVTSFVQDVVFALKTSGDRTLQYHFYNLYVNSLTSLIAHCQHEFVAIKAHLENCDFPYSDLLNSNLNHAEQFGNILDRWNSVLEEIQILFISGNTQECKIDTIESELYSICTAVYSKTECNMQMVQFLQDVGVFSNGQKVVAKNLFKKLIWLLKNGFSFLWNLNGVIFFGGYPYAEREKDGYFQRIRTIDKLFANTWRVYVDHMILPSKPSWYDCPEPNVVVLHMENHKYKWFMRLLVHLCVLRSRHIYYHSVLRMNDSDFGKFMKWPFIKKVIDIHGVVPEEFRMHNDFFSAGIYDEHEKVAVTKADKIILVTEAMNRYFQQKYRERLIVSKIIILPIFPNIATSSLVKPYRDGFPVVVYAGGTHKWQQVPKMITAMGLTKDFCIHKFFCPNPAEVIEMMPENLRHHKNILVDSKPFNELLNEYKLCHFGFILREDIIVNHAACPTKLVEYVAMGIVPIVDCEEMGDFRSLGMQYIKLKDFEEGRLPDEILRNEMAEVNHNIYLKLKEINIKGKCELQNFFAFSNTEFIKEENNEIVTEKIVTEVTEDSNLLPEITTCDILVQVDNFLVGGLENVVLDLNQTLIEAGLKVSLLVLGDAGLGVERAKEKGMNVCITPYDATTYRLLLHSAKPKLIISHYSTNGAEISNELSIPLIQVIHNTYMWFSREQKVQFSIAAKHTSAFIVVSEYVRDYTLARLQIEPEKCFVIPNGLDLTPFKEVDFSCDRTKLREHFKFNEQDFVFLSVGSINHQKNHICTVRAFHKVVEQCPNAKLVILGKVYENQLLIEIQDYIEKHHLENYITYAGETKKPASYYSMADAFVHSAFFEGGQLSLLEAIASNLPIVTTEIGFARHFKGIPGIEIVPPAIEIFDYTGYIWQLNSNIECEERVSKKMVVLYNSRIKPNLPSSFIESLDKQNTYNHYVEFISNMLGGNNTKDFKSENWPKLLKLYKCNEVELHTKSY